MNREILKETLCYAGCITFIILFVYFGGLYNDFSYKNLSDMIVSNVKATGIEQYINRERSPRKKVAAYRNYRPQIIPSEVLDGSVTSKTWTNLFNSNKKVVFYVYNSNDNFHNKISAYFTQKKLYESYNFYPYERHRYENMRTGDIGPAKICNSLKECNRVRAKASNYALLTNFLNKCANTMCIFDSNKNQYVRLKNRNINEAVKMLNILQNW